MDLNLLLGLDALMENRSVQDAAHQLRLTPPAVSRILGRLRTATGDDLLVRSGRLMIPTARALELQDEVRDIVDRAQQILTPAHELHLKELRRVFVLRCHEALLGPIASHLVGVIASEAPFVQLRFVAENADDDRDLIHGQVDLEIGDEPTPSPTVSTRVIASDTMMLITQRGSRLDHDHPAVSTFADAPHIAISRRGRSRGPIDEILETRGMTRNVIATVPTVTAALTILGTTPATTTIPGRLTHALPGPLVARPLPFPLTAAPIALSWHRRHNTDPAHTWLRSIVAQAITNPRTPPDDCRISPR